MPDERRVLRYEARGGAGGSRCLSWGGPQHLLEPHAELLHRVSIALARGPERRRQVHGSQGLVEAYGGREGGVFTAEVSAP